ncbi:MAG: cupin domain-containing protein [Maricaulis sp.]|uniref:cupin domain-containing protein n=1 Tax=Maricaulis sp. TaxID=1486257 RepID=UPI001B2D493D|nr:cupin domain-containing protein [Maricaulis sp.]MBO6729159.1 cupin domain-containing protein [Maricaulis sp.]MBO6846311.1 cupin domain-containing protein [Maricaulis sp.]MBO6875812.1 cupin domain-containing protein [Maricaulis sp.]
MQLHSNFNERVVLRPEDREWVASPASGVERQMLDRIGDEVARATTIVRFAPNSSFEPHGHELGEEYLVLDGVFSDESGEYSAGHYVRNPPGSSHTPFTREGATIFVKLRQFDPMDLAPKSIDTRKADFSPGLVDGLSVLPLQNAGTEGVALVKWEPGTRFNRHRHWGGEEILVLDGTFQDELGDYPKGTWLRNPHLSEHTPFSEDGCLIYVKTGHLPA